MLFTKSSPALAQKVDQAQWQRTNNLTDAHSCCQS
jgi:hypothetical protein